MFGAGQVVFVPSLKALKSLTCSPYTFRVQSREEKRACSQEMVYCTTNSFQTKLLPHRAGITRLKEMLTSRDKPLALEFSCKLFCI